MKTLVIGATGTVGSEVTRNLLAKGEHVRVLTRSADKAKALGNVETFVGDMNEPNKVGDAFRGVDAVFMLNPVSPTEAHEGLCAVNWARQTGVKKFVYMGVQGSEANAFLPHFGTKHAIEQAIRSTGMTHTFLRPNNFFQNDVWFRDAMTKFGVYPQPIGDKGLHRVDVRDIADAAVNALTKSTFDNKAYTLCGPKMVNGMASAEMWSSALGKKITYGGNDLDAWETAAMAMMPAWMVWDLKSMYAMFQQNGFPATSNEITACEQIVGHPLRTFEAYTTECATAWK